MHEGGTNGACNTTSPEHQEKNQTEDLAKQLTSFFPSKKSFFSFTRSEAEAFEKEHKLSHEQLLDRLVVFAQSYAIPPISKFCVGVVGETENGNLYLGVNVEFLKVNLSNSIHAEQFLISNLLLNRETELRRIHLSATPCGHCRQFMNELGCASKMHITLTDGTKNSYPALLPSRFGPADLGRKPEMGQKFSEAQYQISKEDREKHTDLITSALDALSYSWGVYSNCPSAVAIRTREGAIYSGSYLENAAYNPSLSPLQVALVAMVCGQGHNWESIQEVLLLEKDGAVVDQDGWTRLLLSAISPSAKTSALLLPTNFISMTTTS